MCVETNMHVNTQDRLWGFKSIRAVLCPKAWSVNLTSLSLLEEWRYLPQAINNLPLLFWWCHTAFSLPGFIRYSLKNAFPLLLLQWSFNSDLESCVAHWGKVPMCSQCCSQCDYLPPPMYANTRCTVVLGWNADQSPLLVLSLQSICAVFFFFFFQKEDLSHREGDWRQLCKLSSNLSLEQATRGDRAQPGSQDCSDPHLTPTFIPF